MCTRTTHRQVTHLPTSETASIPAQRFYRSGYFKEDLLVVLYDLLVQQLVLPGGIRKICMIYLRTRFLSWTCATYLQVLRSLSQRQARNYSR